MKDIGKKKIWIDLENSPHVPFFKPIIDELKSRGYTILLTARDGAQTCGLAGLLHLQYIRVGRQYGKNKVMKLMGLLFRVLQFMPIILREKPALALSHGSRAQLLLASLLRIPTVEMMDYEHTYTVPFSGPDWIIMPDVISPATVTTEKDRIVTYSGIKEDIYAPGFIPGKSIKEIFKIRDSELAITIRPPATEAHYFVQESQELFVWTVEFLMQKENVRLIIVPRSEKQRTHIEQEWSSWIAQGKVILPDHVLDGLNLIWHSDLVISGGGTMNREAAALGVPVYSIFRGKIGAVDRYLADSGRLVLLESREDVRSKIDFSPRKQPEKPEHLNNGALKSVVDKIIEIAEREAAMVHAKQIKRGVLR